MLTKQFKILATKIF